MKAKEARELAIHKSKDSDKIKNQLKEVFSKIEDSANNGDFYLEFENLLPPSIQILKENGFIINSAGINVVDMENEIYEYIIKW